jgi:hypothetical protein
MDGGSHTIKHHYSCRGLGEEWGGKSLKEMLGGV